MKVGTPIFPPIGAAVVAFGLLVLAPLATMAAATPSQGNGRAQSKRHVQDVGPGLHKMIGVDYRPADLSAIGFEYDRHAKLQAMEIKKAAKDPLIKVGSRQKSESIVPLADTCLLFADEFDKLDNSIWRVSEMYA